MVSIGSIINYPTVHKKQVSGEVSAILENTVVIIDSLKQTHLVLKSIIISDGYSIDDKTPIFKTGYKKENS